MSKLETIVAELKTLPPDRLDSAADYIHRLKTIGSAERMAIIKRTAGSLTPEEGDAPDEGTAHYYGRIHADLARLGKPIPQNDIWIAAIALEHNLPLATRDHHFSLVSGLTLLAW